MYLDENIFSRAIIDFKCNSLAVVLNQRNSRAQIENDRGAISVSGAFAMTINPIDQAFSGASKEKEGSFPKHETEALQALMNFRQIIGAAKRHFQLVQAECDLSGAQLWALWQISAEPGLKVGELARHLSIHQSTASNLLDQLQKKDMIIRDRKGNDQRVVRIYLSEAGKKILSKAPGPARGVLPDAIDHLSEYELQQLNNSLRLVLGYMDTQDKEASKRPLSDIIT